MIPQNYAQWRRCIEVDCGMALTADFIAERLSSMGAEASEEAQRFERLYGRDHLQRVVGWFHAAQTARALPR